TYRVVDGPGGLSVGNRMITLLPVETQVSRPPGPLVTWLTAPFDCRASVAPVPRFVKVSAEPVPAESVRMRLPFRSKNSRMTWLPPVPSICTSNAQAFPAGKIAVKSAIAEPEKLSPATKNHAGTERRGDF